MINRVRNQSQYVFNSKTGMLEKVDNIENIPKKANKKKSKTNNGYQPVTSITVITSDDNLIHNYFTSFETSWDATNCLQIATIKMPDMGEENINYWATYTGQLTVYMGYNFTYDKVNTNQHNSEQEAADSLARYWDNSQIKPYFRGEVDRIKQHKNHIIIYVKNIGARFQQKIPEDFRQAFIYNQPVRDSFQAMCEFLGVVHICPPQIITDQAGEETLENNNDGTENDVGDRVSVENSLANKANQQTSNNPNDTSTSTNDTNSDGTSEETEDQNGLDEDVNEIINGYNDVSFDANGAIVHSSVVIETSPDMAKTLIAMEEHPFEQYLEDETGIVEKVQNFLDGEMFDELHNNVMNYDSITIEPKSAPSSNMTIDNDMDNNNDDESNNPDNNNDNNTNNNTTTQSNN